MCATPPCVNSPSLRAGGFSEKDNTLISAKTAYDIARAYEEIDRAEKLLADVQGSLSRREVPNIRDALGRSQGGLQLGVPSGDNSTRLYMVDWNLCVPVLTAHIGQTKARLSALNELARSELDAATPTGETP